jgi:hypothetical protein
MKGTYDVPRRKCLWTRKLGVRAGESLLPPPASLAVSIYVVGLRVPTGLDRYSADAGTLVISKSSRTENPSSERIH